MSRKSKPVSPGITWCWKRWVPVSHQEAWAGRLDAVEGLAWSSTQRPDRTRVLLAVYARRRAEVARLKPLFGGRIVAVKPSAWLTTKPRPPLRIGNRFQVIDESTPVAKETALPSLRIPHGLAFGSGEHATTGMLLQALARCGDGSDLSVLDLGTGSGVLALAARLLGARRIVATDFDPAAVRTAAANEALNFSTSTIRWRCADVKKLRPGIRYDLVLANLFSGILVEAAPQIAASVKPGGELWLSGVLRSQQDEVARAYRRQRLKLIRAVTRGKWVMLQWQPPPSSGTTITKSSGDS